MLGIAKIALLSLLIANAAAEGFSQVSLSPSGSLANTALIQEWRALLGSGAEMAESAKVRRVNDFFNQRIQFEEDSEVWGQSDYWATPLETLVQKRGDCEDFAIAKYFTLLELGVPVSRLRLVYVKVSQDGMAGAISRAHMVLAYYPHQGSTPMVLDNLSADVVPASARPDLIPVFSFNTEGLWVGTSNQTSTSSYSRWQELVARTRSEGFLKNRTGHIQRAGL
jgi:predicted transglutaminase-like cysteine proteinase